MSRINAIKSGLWSDTSIWPGGVLPGEESEVFCNGHNIIIDTDIKVKLISNAQTYPDIFGGEITIENGVTVTGNLEAHMVCLLKNIQSGIINLKGSVKGSMTTSSIPGIINSGTGIINIEGIVRGGNFYNACGIVIESGVVNVTGKLCYGGAHYSYPVQNIGGTLILNGTSYTESNYYGEDRCFEIEQQGVIV
jgi:hypothetical protein